MSAFLRLPQKNTGSTAAPCVFRFPYHLERFSTSHTNAHTRCTEEMLIFSRGVWMSSRSGPMDTQSSPGSLPASRPHSRPAWMAYTRGSAPYWSR